MIAMTAACLGLEWRMRTTVAGPMGQCGLGVGLCLRCSTQRAALQAESGKGLMTSESAVRCSTSLARVALRTTVSCSITNGRRHYFLACHVEVNSVEAHLSRTSYPYSRLFLRTSILLLSRAPC